MAARSLGFGTQAVGMGCAEIWRRRVQRIFSILLCSGCES